MTKCASAALRTFLATALLSCSFGAPAVAQTVPTPWISADIGAPAISGRATYSSGVFTINAAGVDIYGTSDQFHFVYQPVAGDVEVIARVLSLTGGEPPAANAGVMIRASLAANAAHGYAFASVSNGLRFRRRLSTGATTSSVAGIAAAPPAWVRIVRQGSLVTGYASVNGTSWTKISSSTIALGTTAYVGIAATSHNAGMLATDRVSDVKVTRLALPSGQQTMDIGAPAIAGSTIYSNGSYTVKAAGTDIWDTADQFRFVYQPMSGNGEVVARVASITAAHAGSKAGVMIREALTAQSRHVSVLASAWNGYTFRRRPDPAAYSVHTSGGTGAPPGWVRLVRTGNLFEAYRSANGTTWTKIGSDTIAMGATVYVGLAVTSRNVSTATTAVIDNLRVTSGATGNQPPAVSVTTPTVGATFTAPATVTIAATATDPEGRMLSVDFYAGTTLITRDTTAPYSVSWSAAAAGTYSLTAVAHDADGGSTTSSAVTVTVQGTNRAPTVSFTSPSNGASYVAPAEILLTATASDPENQLARVELYNGTTRLKSDTTVPYSFRLTNLAAGTYTLKAVAYDAAGASASASVSVTVTGGTQTPPRWVVFVASSTHATGVTNYQLRVFAAGANTATATPVATSDLGKPTPAANGEITVDRGAFFTALAVGNYAATVMAIGPGGQVQSSAITFTR